MLQELGKSTRAEGTALRVASCAAGCMYMSCRGMQGIGIRLLGDSRVLSWPGFGYNLSIAYSQISAPHAADQACRYASDFLRSYP